MASASDMLPGTKYSCPPAITRSSASAVCAYPDRLFHRSRAIYVHYTYIPEPAYEANPSRLLLDRLRQKNRHVPEKRHRVDEQHLESGYGVHEGQRRVRPMLRRTVFRAFSRGRGPSLRTRL